MDNAPSHGRQTQRMLREYCDANNLNLVQYTTHSAQSPDLNICDLATFNLKNTSTER